MRVQACRCTETCRVEASRLQVHRWVAGRAVRVRVSPCTGLSVAVSKENLRNGKRPQAFPKTCIPAHRASGCSWMFPPSRLGSRGPLGPQEEASAVCASHGHLPRGPGHQRPPGLSSLRWPGGGGRRAPAGAGSTGQGGSKKRGPGQHLPTSLRDAGSRVTISAPPAAAGPPLLPAASVKRAEASCCDRKRPEYSTPHFGDQWKAVPSPFQFPCRIPVLQGLVTQESDNQVHGVRWRLRQSLCQPRAAVQQREPAGTGAQRRAPRSGRPSLFLVGSTLRPDHQQSLLDTARVPSCPRRPLHSTVLSEALPRSPARPSRAPQGPHRSRGRILPSV